MADVSRLLGVSWVVLAITALASAVLGWFASGRVLRPLREMTSTARTISAGNLSRRLALTGPDDEFKQLGETLNDLLARLEAAFEAQRRFVANASHELRTPLTLKGRCSRWRWRTRTRALQACVLRARSCFSRGASRSGCSKRF